ncbi:hypothetical protein BIV60_26430 [Bacillus sp. MUM 116]|uniref:hypothetical protein n=1 Tax=Bacillus sp. MUM 116 TaxID=1678002 RepID=UPI0008F58E30|nr:hypothetical protein [Bacillus sp. MUM 116]OIK08407.1 hypothetical protein BIV60_26430 [Bacillus sp. MUM 116]
MNRRKFILDLIFWILAFFLGYSIKKDVEDWNFFKKDASVADIKKQVRKRVGSETDDTKRVQELFNEKGKIYFPKDTYIISKTITIYDDTEVICHPQATFLLAANARCYMFKSDTTTGKKNFKWSGGIIDGNDANQGNETVSGTNHNVSRGLTLYNFYKIEVCNLLIKSIRGQAITHWGNQHAYFHDIEIWQDLSPFELTLFPGGGSRRDGITGASRNLTYENIRGFTDDDFIAIAPGCNWEGGGNLFPIDSVFIRNIKMERNGKDSSFASYRGFAVYSGGFDYKIKNIVIENVNATVNTEFMRIQGVIDNLSIKDINATLDMKDPSNARGFLWVRLVQNNGGSEDIGGSIINNLTINKVNYQYVNTNVLKPYVNVSDSSNIKNLKLSDIYGYYPINVSSGGEFINVDANSIINNLELN